MSDDDDLAWTVTPITVEGKPRVQVSVKDSQGNAGWAVDRDENKARWRASLRLKAARENWWGIRGGV